MTAVGSVVRQLRRSSAAAADVDMLVGCIILFFDDDELPDGRRYFFAAACGAMVVCYTICCERFALQCKISVLFCKISEGIQKNVRNESKRTKKIGPGSNTAQSWIPIPRTRLRVRISLSVLLRSTLSYHNLPQNSSVKIKKSITMKMMVVP